MAALAVAAGALAAGSAGAAAPQRQQVLLLSPGTRLTPEPPLLPDYRLRETRWRGRISSRERVAVTVDRGGRVVGVGVRQRLVIGGKGDYVFAVPAPVVDVRAGPGSQSQPGLRRNRVLWQGFSPGGRVLVADATLDPRQAERTLPLRVRVGRAGEDLSLTLENATTARALAVTGTGDARELRGILARAGSARRGEQISATLVGKTGSRTISVEAPLRVEGALVYPRGALAGARVTGGRVAGDEVRFESLLGGGAPIRLQVGVRGARGEPTLRLRAVAVVPAALLRAPAGLDGHALLDRTMDALLRLARAAQYDTYLANPDVRGTSSTVYDYRTGAATTAAPAPPPRDDGWTAWQKALALLGVALAAVLLLVAWAHA